LAGLTLAVAAVLLGTALVAATLHAPEGPASNHTVRAPIDIESNSQFTAANGVVGGSGTPSDPYVISGWEITNVDTMAAIFIRDTDASFVIRDVDVHQPPGLGWAGIRFIEVTNARVEDSTVAGFSWGVSLEFTSNITVTRSNVTHNGLGIQLWFTNDTEPGVSVSNSNVSDDGVGVSIAYGGRNVIADNLLSNNSCAIQVGDSTNLTVRGNEVMKSHLQGALIERTSNVTIESNHFALNGAGLWLTDSPNATVTGNRFVSEGMMLRGSTAASLASHTISPDNLVNGKPIRYFKGESGLVVDGLGLGQLIVVESTDVTIRNVSANDTDVGLELMRVQRATVESSNFSGDGQGLLLDNASDVVLTRDSAWFSNQTYLPSSRAIGSGVHLLNSWNVTVSSSDLSRNENAGLFIDGSSRNVSVADSSLINNSVAILASGVSGLTVSLSHLDRNSETIIVTDSRDVAVVSDRITRSVYTSADFQQITSLTVSSNEFVENGGPFCVRFVHVATVSMNTVESNRASGLCLVNTFSVNVTENLFVNNTGLGVLVYDSEGMQAFHNAFADNYVSYGSQAYDSSPNPNAWDDGYPSGGNFWSNYHGADQCSGPGQDICTGPDGIGDTPYPITVIGEDRYPLIQSPFHDSVPPTVAIVSPSEGAAFNVSSVTVMGTASDAGGSGLRVVKVRVGGAAWSDAADLATWTAQVTLAPGANRIDAQSFDNAGNPSDVRSVNVTFTPPPPPPPPPNTPPYANFSYTPATGNTTTVFTFTSTSFDHEDPTDLLQMRWDWETDGVWDTPWSHNATEEHRFTVPGTYSVTMEVIDPGNLSANRTATVIVSAVPPPPPPPLVVEITATPTNGTMPLTVSFTSNVSGGVPPYAYDWEFGDGSKSNVADTVHIYITGGNFTVWLDVNDNGGTSAQSALFFVNVTPAAVNLTVTPPTHYVAGSTGISVNFTASVTGGTPPYTFHWDFGDGGQSDAPSPTHTYATDGTYRVSVTVTDTYGQSVTRTFEFVVPPHSSPSSEGGLMPFVLAGAIAVAMAFAVLWRNERRRRRAPPSPPLR